jgi:hypothetical protein
MTFGRIQSKADEQSVQQEDGNSEVPALPKFVYPLASGMNFKAPLGDSGFSNINISLDYNPKSSPMALTTVTARINFNTHGRRHITAVSLSISIPNNEASEIESIPNSSSLEKVITDVQVRETRQVDKHFDGLSVGVSQVKVEVKGGASSGQTSERSETAKKEYTKTSTARLDPEDSGVIIWQIKAPGSLTDHEGLREEERMTFTLRRKPEKFFYTCLVDHAKDGKQFTGKHGSLNLPKRVLRWVGL